MTASLASLARQMNLDPVQAIALPTVITVAARKVGMTESQMAWEAAKNESLRNYLASICNDINITGGE